MNFLVLSHTHHLLPFAYRLQLHGANVRAAVTVQAFEAAWHGKREPTPRDDKGRLDLKWLAEQTQQEDLIVLTDDWKLQERLALPDHLVFGVAEQRHTQMDSLIQPIRVGCWISGEEILAPHLLVVDRGAWPSGMGPAIDGALTLIRVDNHETLALLEELIRESVDDLASKGFQGLAQFELNFQTETGNPEVSGVLAGWPFLQAHAFLSELDDFTGLLTRTETKNLLPRKFVSVVPISRPPWPTRKARFRFDTPEIRGLTPAQIGRVFWHDVQVDEAEGRLRSAGLDGLVGVARGAADTNELALVRALEVALRLRLPEKQFRSDAGRQVQSALAELEGRFGLLI